MSQEECEGIKVGDIITAYHKGYHRVVGFCTYADLHPGYTNDTAQQVQYKTVLTRNGKPRKSKVQTCHINYCTVVNETSVLAEFEAEFKAAEQKRDVLLSILKGDSDET